jgi:hypothetical protein
MSFFFQLRKDLYNRNSQSLLVNSAIATKNNQFNTNIARSYINSVVTSNNTLITETSTIKSIIQNKIDKTEIYTVLDNYYGSGGGNNYVGSYNTSQIMNLINNVIQKAISDINLTKEQSILKVTELLLEAEKYADKSEIGAINAEESKKAAVLSATSSSTSAAASSASASVSATSAASAALSVEKANCQARKSEESAERAARQAKQVEESQMSAAVSATSAATSATLAAASESAAKILSLSISETAAAITIAICNNINSNKELIDKIEYLFHFFYHGDSTTIMENYPII